VIGLYLDDTVKCVVSLIVCRYVDGVDELHDCFDGINVVDQQVLPEVQEHVDAPDDCQWRIVVERFESYCVDASL